MIFIDEHYDFAYEGASVMFEIDQSDASLYSLWSNNRGKGEASKLLDYICYISDVYGINLHLSAYPNNQEWISHEALVAFYMRKGFEFTEPNKLGCSGVRTPREPMAHMEISEEVHSRIKSKMYPCEEDDEDYDY
jgi:hypothetical protein